MSQLCGWKISATSARGVLETARSILIPQGSTCFSAMVCDSIEQYRGGQSFLLCLAGLEVRVHHAIFHPRLLHLLFCVLCCPRRSAAPPGLIAPCTATSMVPRALGPVTSAGPAPALPLSSSDVRAHGTHSCMHSELAVPTMTGRSRGRAGCPPQAPPGKGVNGSEAAGALVS